MPTAAELVQLAAGKPWMLGMNTLRLASAGRWNVTGSMAAGDITNAAAPVSRAYDDHAGMYTQPNSTILAGTTVYLVFDLSSAASLLTSLDTIVADIDVRGCGTAVDIRAELDTLGTFPAPQIITSTDTLVAAGAGNNRGNFKWVKPDLVANAQYSTQGFMRFRIRSTGVGGFLDVPRIGEIYTGIRRQLAHFPRIPYDEQRRTTTVADFVAYNGRRHRIVRRKGAQPYPVRFMTSGQTLAGVDEISNLRNWWKDTDQGARPFYYGDQLATGGDPRRALFLDIPGPEPSFDLPVSGYETREIEADFREMVPYRTLEIAT